MELIRTIEKKLNDRGYRITNLKEYNEKYKCLVIENKTGYRIKLEIPKNLGEHYINRFVNSYVIDYIDTRKVCEIASD